MTENSGQRSFGVVVE